MAENRSGPPQRKEGIVISEYPNITNQITMVLLFCQAVEHAAAEQGLNSGREYLLLKRIARKDGSSERNVANSMNMQVSSASGMLNFMASKGLIRFDRSQDDGRRIRCHVTDAGLDLISRCEQSIDERIDDILEPVAVGKRSFLDMGMVATAISLRRADCDERGFNRSSAYAESCLRFRRKLIEITRSFDSSLNGFRLLLLLGEYPDGMRPKDACSRLLLRKSTLSSVANTLVRRELVDRTVDTRDKRTQILRNSKTGENLAARIVVPIENHFMFGPKNSDKQERTMYGRVAEDIVNAWSIHYP